MKIIFAGTPEFAAAHLQTLLDSEHDVIGVYSQPDRPAGRGKKLTASPVKQLALQHDIPVFQPANFKLTEDVQQLDDLAADIMVVVAYGLLLPESVLNAPRLGCINVHASLLPRWRGAAPIQRAIESQDDESGVTIMQMDKGLDTGDMLIKTRLEITSEMTGGELHDALLEQGGPALLDALNQLEQGTAQPEKQDDSQANYAHKMLKAEANIDWSQSAAAIAAKIRAFNPWPVCYSQLGDDRIRIWQAEFVNEQARVSPGTIIKVDKEGIDVACGQHVLRLQTIQLAGKKANSVANVLNSRNELFNPNYMFSSNL